MMEPIVMIPGLGSDRAVWGRTIAALGNDVDCIVGDTLSDATLTDMARRIVAQAPDRFALAGISMGGMVALEVMRIAPDRVTRLALMDTNAQPDSFARKMTRHLSNFVIGRTRDFRPLVVRSLGSLVHPACPDDVRDELIEMSLRVGTKAYVRQNRAVIARDDLRAILPGITVPTSVIVGRDDAMTPRPLSQFIHKQVPTSSLHVIADCGHLPSIEKPLETARLLRDLMNEAKRS